MPQIRPFVGLLFDPSAGPPEAVTEPPLDALNPIDERHFRARPSDATPFDRASDEPQRGPARTQYTEAVSLLRRWREEGVLLPTPGPSAFPYEMVFQHGGARGRVRGVIAEVTLEPWGGSIIPHERTMAASIERRLALMRAIRANVSPIYSVSLEPADALQDFLDRETARPPDRTVTDQTGTLHRLWVAPGETFREVERSLASRTLMIADGHHRYTVGLALREQMRRDGPGPWDSIMMFVVDAASEAPPVLPIHRVVKGSVPAVVERGRRVRDLAEILATIHDEDLAYGTVTVEQGVVAHRVARLAGTPPTVSVLHSVVLDRLDEPDMRFVSDAAIAEEAVRSGAGSVAFLLPPTTVDRIRSVLQSGARLPQKSTWFWPKPRPGVVLRPFDP